MKVLTDWIVGVVAIGFGVMCIWAFIKAVWWIVFVL